MDHFKGLNAREKYDNDLLNEIRKLNINMEKLLGGDNHVSSSTEGVPIDGDGEGQQGQRTSNGNVRGGKRKST